MKLILEQPTTSEATLVILVPSTYSRWVELQEFVEEWMYTGPYHISFWVPVRCLGLVDLADHISPDFYAYIEAELEGGYYE